VNCPVAFERAPVISDREISDGRAAVISYFQVSNILLERSGVAKYGPVWNEPPGLTLVLTVVNAEIEALLRST
jgi:hypothetical protein